MQRAQKGGFMPSSTGVALVSTQCPQPCGCPVGCSAEGAGGAGAIGLGSRSCPCFKLEAAKTLHGRPPARSRVSHTLTSTSSTSVEVLGWRLCFAPACHCVAEGDGLVCGMKKGNAETFPRAVAEPVCPCAGWGANLEVQPFAFCIWGALSAAHLHLHSFSQTSKWLCTHPASSKDRNLHFSLHFWKAEILESLNHLTCPLLCCLCCIPFI